LRDSSEQNPEAKEHRVMLLEAWYFFLIIFGSFKVFFWYCLSVERNHFDAAVDTSNTLFQILVE
jgi:hypothetical protein